MKHKRKRIAILVQNLHNGGAERMAANMALELSAYYSVWLIVFDGRDAIYPYGGRLIDLKLPPSEDENIAQRLVKLVYRVRRLRYLKRSLRIDCCISHMNSANVINILSKGKEKVYSIYHSMPSACDGKGKTAAQLHRFIAAGSERYYCVSRLAAMDMAKSYGIAPEKLGCIYNFLDPEKIEVQSREALPADAAAFYAKHPRMLISMGRLTAMKGQDRMIRLLRELRKEDDGVGLTILGEGEERASLTALAGELELTEHVYLPGELPNPFPWLKAASVFLLFSDYEGLPMVLIEAASVKLPVAACDVASGPREILAPDTDIQNFTDKAEYARYGVLLPSLAGEERRGELGEKECMTEQAVKRLLYDEELRGRYIERSAECAERFSAAQQIGKWRKRIDG